MHQRYFPFFHKKLEEGWRRTRDRKREWAEGAEKGGGRRKKRRWRAKGDASDVEVDSILSWRLWAGLDTERSGLPQALWSSEAPWGRGPRFQELL